MNPGELPTSFRDPWGMSRSPLFAEFDGAPIIGGARVLPGFARSYPGLDRDAWYPVIDGVAEFGAYLVVKEVPRFVSSEHFEIIELSE